MYNEFRHIVTEGIFTFEIYNSPYTGQYYVSIRYADESINFFADTCDTLEEAIASMDDYRKDFSQYKAKGEYEAWLYKDMD